MDQVLIKKVFYYSSRGASRGCSLWEEVSFGGNRGAALNVPSLCWRYVPNTRNLVAFKCKVCKAGSLGAVSESLASPGARGATDRPPVSTTLLIPERLWDWSHLR